ncbi:MAG: Carboxylate-amine ligase YbdK [Methanoregulaceae archaeon PtaU1.Bin059]|nr:MAG: Carboxylate-amine ligase YbdK [Methanoregulaceae archaeon PtaU1.Bin059]
MKTGTEHEYSLNGPGFVPLPESDLVLAEIGGGWDGEMPLGGAKACKELQKHVIELIPLHPSESLSDLESSVQGGVREFSRRFAGRYRLLGLGMHPTLSLDRAQVWDHGEGEYYTAYDRLFGIRQHGWLNIQALQVNFEYPDESRLVSLHNRIRCLLPFLIAVSAASPFVEGKAPGPVDNRLLFYRENQARIPAICNGIVPDPISTVADYRDRLSGMYAELRAQGAGVLCEEWVASSGVIVRFSRPCIEIKAIDEQECVFSDMALCAFVRALARARDLPLEEDRDTLVAMTERAIRAGTAGLEDELAALYRRAEKVATGDERRYLPLVRTRIEEGSLGQVLAERFYDTGDLQGIMQDLAMCLEENRPYVGNSEWV